MGCLLAAGRRLALGPKERQVQQRRRISKKAGRRASLTSAYREKQRQVDQGDSLVLHLSKKSKRKRTRAGRRPRFVFITAYGYRRTGETSTRHCPAKLFTAFLYTTLALPGEVATNGTTQNVHPCITTTTTSPLPLLLTSTLRFTFKLLTCTHAPSLIHIH